MENSQELMTQTKCLHYEVQFTMVLLTKKCFSQSHLARMVYDISYQVRWKSRVKLSKRIALTLSLHRYKSHFMYLRYVASSTNDMEGINCLYLEKPKSHIG